MIACAQQYTNDTFIVPLDTMPLYKADSSKIPPDPPPPRPERAYYFPSNFIIDSTGKVFFYQKQVIWSIDGNNTDWNTPPEFINLRPKDILQIPDNSIEEFIKLNVLNIDSAKRYVAIAAAKDTIKSLGLSKIIAICKDKENHLRWKFRIITQEEGIVLEYKKRQEPYYPDEIKWDSTKIRMPMLKK